MYVFKQQNSILAVVLLLMVVFVSFIRTSDGTPNRTGEMLFKEHCAVCHPGGGNIVSPKKTLHRTDREANGIASEADIVRLMRKPGPGMSIFTEKMIPDKEAAEIAKYIIRSFTK